MMMIVYMYLYEHGYMTAYVGRMGLLYILVIVYMYLYEHGYVFCYYVIGIYVFFDVILVIDINEF